MAGEKEYRSRIERVARAAYLKDVKDSIEEKKKKEDNNKQEDKKETKKIIMPSIDGVKKTIDNFQKKSEDREEDEER